MPDMMQAVVLTTYGSPDDLELVEVERAVPKEGEVGIRIHASSVNDWEWSLARGKPVYIRAFGGLVRPNGRIIGCDFAGRIEAVGPGVEQLEIGDDVYGDLSDSGFGAYAEHVCAPEGAVARMPHNLTYEEAAGLPHAAGLAWQSLYDIGGVDRARTLLVNGAGGGVGPLAVQLAKRHDVEVTGVDHTSKQDFLRSLGFDHAVDYTQDDFTDTGNRYDLILDAKTNRSPSGYVPALEAGGTYVTVGGAALRLAQCALLGGWIGKTKGRQIRVLALKPNKGLDDMAALIEAGEVVPSIDSVYPLSDIAAALHRFGEASQHGKVIISMP